MTRTAAIIAALALTLTAAPSFATGGYSLDKAGKCHDAKGKFAKSEMCKAAAPTPPKHCKDPKTKRFTKCTAPGAVPA